MITVNLARAELVYVAMQSPGDKRKTADMYVGHKSTKWLYWRKNLCNTNFKYIFHIAIGNYSSKYEI